jgi:hypothetical protein
VNDEEECGEDPKLSNSLCVAYSSQSDLARVQGCSYVPFSNHNTHANSRRKARYSLRTAEQHLQVAFELAARSLSPR